MTTKLYNYLEGELSEQEKNSFEQKMAEQPNLKETVDLYNDVDDFMRHEMELEEMKARVSKIHENYEAEQKFGSKRTIWLRWTSIAASILLIVGVVSFLALFNDRPSAIYKNHYTAWEPRAITRGHNTNDVLTQWITYYNAHDYKAAIEKFELLPQSYKEHPQVLLMYCSALMESESFEKALSVLDGFNLEGYSMFEHDFMWYISLCNLKLDNTSEALVGFAELKDTKKYGERVEAILSNME